MMLPLASAVVMPTNGLLKAMAMEVLEDMLLRVVPVGPVLSETMVVYKMEPVEPVEPVGGSWAITGTPIPVKPVALVPMEVAAAVVAVLAVLMRALIRGVLAVEVVVQGGVQL